ncbi:hypothetical protein Pst134EA_011878 [Puccinia striiformis f. sp. tritici]|uniref:hypothetical protein n=1 Tax=Puccinia striiformis f. sp. tritici TaxID=168172 RepID=UPI002007C5D4|nr:hypothetical protein Pst134EA_011878 [Puccinia striiformis f. sp. tritici]KAH9468253.1 hypothetical protein Pst134EA_011878 [Puccinia striiformis f. sp. tritici]
MINFTTMLRQSYRRPVVNNWNRAAQRGPVSFARGISAVGYYNRAIESDELLRTLKGKARFTVLLGPPSSGKTALMQHVASSIRSDGTVDFHPLTVDLRGVSAFEKRGFLNAFLRKGSKAGKLVKNYETAFSQVEMSAAGLALKFGGIQFSDVSAGTIFDELADQLRSWSWLHGDRPPVLIIDEANAFQRMDDETTAAFLDFVVRVTKQEHTMHVVFTSSDSFFENWLKKRVNPCHFQTLVLGDLTRKEAHDYYLHLVNSHPYMSLNMKNNLTNLDFKVPFGMTGGRMFFIKAYVHQVYTSGYFDDPMHFKPVQNYISTMENDFTGDPKTYTAAQAIYVARLLADSPGYLSYRELKKELGIEVIEEMISRNFLHYRPISTFARDLIPFPLMPVLTASSEPARRAMEYLLEAHGKDLSS